MQGLTLAQEMVQGPRQTASQSCTVSPPGLHPPRGSRMRKKAKDDRDFTIPAPEVIKLLKEYKEFSNIKENAESVLAVAIEATE
ncbi:hypothetical protein M422DRAFT_254375 [Sphaerobolus stellatus SS14]|uniref:Uncharacterized protein n=1 Tax=Sphaerobolus stellatus (strain SS14) TaxID=990650 RepID=A0A0C9V6I1_SPHS4|nr:hypothetical protein M422DRAFT_254375 [Sphaerobolus stellatus SS14]